MFKAFASYWKRFRDFSGVSKRSDYWWVVLIQSIIIGVLYLLVLLTLNFVPIFILIVYSIVNILPSYALIIRRLRDAGYAWYYIFMNLVPFVGGIIFIVLMCKDSVEDKEFDEAHKFRPRAEGDVYRENNSYNQSYSPIGGTQTTELYNNGTGNLYGEESKKESPESLIKSYKNMLDRGVITEAEFEEEKERILAEQRNSQE